MDNNAQLELHPSLTMECVEQLMRQAFFAVYSDVVDHIVGPHSQLPTAPDLTRPSPSYHAQMPKTCHLPTLKHHIGNFLSSTLQCLPRP
eukprot:2056546-Rhodomonas_salina.2